MLFEASLYTTTIKYFRLALGEFIPFIESLIKNPQEAKTIEELNDYLEMYNDIARKIDSYGLNLEDPNRNFDGEPIEIALAKLKLSDENIEHLSRLTLRLLIKWQEEYEKLKNKSYLTEENERRKYSLEKFIWPLEALSNNGGFVLNKYKKKGPIVFPGEVKIKEKEKTEDKNAMGIFPEKLMNILPKDLSALCEEFNFNFHNSKPNSCLLLLRKILPLSVVRKFQKLNREGEIKSNDEYLETKGLLGKIEKELNDKRLYLRICNLKSLTDSIQHSFTFQADILDAQNAAVEIRILLDDLFNSV